MDSGTWDDLGPKLDQLRDADPRRKTWRSHRRRRLVRVAAHRGVSAQPAHLDHVALRPRCGSGAGEPRQVRTRRCLTCGSRPATTICSHRPTWTSSRSRRRTICMRTRPWRPPGPASISCSKSRPASTCPSSCAFATPSGRSGVRTIVSFELRYNPFLKFARWLRTEGWLGDIRFARTQYLSRVTDWYSGWDWVRTRESGRSHLLAAGCHAVDALRWCSGLEPIAVSAFHTHFTAGYEWPTSIVANMRLERAALGHVTSSTDFMLPYTFLVELMGDRATLRQDTAAVARHAGRLRSALRRQPVSGRAPRDQRRCRRAGRRSASTARCPVRRT